MLSERNIARAGKWMMACLLIWLSTFHAAGAEMIVYRPDAEQVEQAVAADDSVQEEGEQLRTGPVLMVTDYAVVEGETLLGSSFVLQMNIANLSEDSPAHNVLATMTIENTSVSLQEGATNQKYFHEIPPMGTVSVQFPLEVYSYCTEENMILSMTMTCYDDAAVHYDFQTMMTPGIEVRRTLQVGSLAVPLFVHRNTNMTIGATLTNVEPVALNNIRMHVITQYGEQITEVGQLLKGESKTVNSIYRFPEQQTEEVQVYFTYESLYGHEYATDPQTFEVVVYDPAVENSFAASGAWSVEKIVKRLMESTTVSAAGRQIQIPALAWILAGCVGYGVVVYCVLRRKKR